MKPKGAEEEEKAKKLDHQNRLMMSQHKHVHIHEQYDLQPHCLF